MEKIGISDERTYDRDRVLNGHGPHRMLEMVQDKKMTEPKGKSVDPRRKQFSIRNYDHCTCGHTRAGHENFKDSCEKCDCNVFHRGIHLGQLPEH